MEQKRPLTFVIFILRLFSAIVGGAAGTLALFVVYFVLYKLIPQAEGATSLSMFVIIIMTFVGTLVANTLTAVMVTFMDSAKYSRRKTTIMHVFLFNFILFFLTIPLYFLGNLLDIVNGIAAVHFLLSAFITGLIMEMLAGSEYALLGVYGNALGIFISIGLSLSMIAMGMRPIALMFAAMPAVWIILQTVSAFSELIYDNFVRLYGIDAFNIRTDLGGDTEKEPEEEDEEENEKND